MTDQDVLDYLNGLAEGQIAIADGFHRTQFIEHILYDGYPVRSVQELTNQGQLAATDTVHKYWAHLLNYGTHHLSALACLLGKVNLHDCHFPTVLDVGCGIGTASIGLKLFGLNVGDRIVGLDHNENALLTFQKLLRPTFSDISGLTDIRDMPAIDDDVLVVCSSVFGQSTVDERIAAEIANTLVAKVAGTITVLETTATSPSKSAYFRTCLINAGKNRGAEAVLASVDLRCTCSFPDWNEDGRTLGRTAPLKAQGSVVQIGPRS